MNYMGIPWEKVHVVDAIWDKQNGANGCTKSHIKALTTAKENKWKL